MAVPSLILKYILWYIMLWIILPACAALVIFIGWNRHCANRLRNCNHDDDVDTSSASKRPNQRRRRVIAFYHPYCSSGGGGERVLWKAIQVLGDLVEKRGLNLYIVIYTIDVPSSNYQKDLLQHVQDRFSIHLSNQITDASTGRLSFVHLHEYKHYLQPSTSFSLLVESWGTMKLAWQALQQSSKIKMMPHVFVDTTGCAFTFIVACILFGCKIMAYVHYPTISTDMLHLVWQRRRSAYNHADYIAKSSVTTYIKLVYYILFAVLYGMVGSLASVVMVNSTWTYNHISSLWKGATWKQCIHIVYPPCNVECFQNEKDTDDTLVERRQREAVIVSIGQFRPEKDHVLQIQAMAKLLQEHPNLKDAKLVLIGSCRGADDEARLEHLRQLAASPKYQLNKKSESSSQKEGDDDDDDDRVVFVVNQKYAVIQDWLQRRASVGIHTMWNEHFGIGIVEMMAAGLIVVAHNSGGPQSDIVVPLIIDNNSKYNNDDNKEKRTGFLATNCEEYAQALYQALTMDKVQSQQIRANARVSSQRFSDEVFAQNFERIVLESQLIL